MNLLKTLRKSQTEMKGVNNNDDDDGEETAELHNNKGALTSFESKELKINLPQDVRLNSFECLKVVGEGSFAKVYQGKKNNCMITA